MRFYFHTALPVEECRRRLEASTDPDNFLFPARGTAQVLAQVGTKRFRLRHRGGMGNAFAPRFYGRLKVNGHGTDIVGRVRLPFSTMAFFTVLFLAILFVTSPTPWSVPVGGLKRQLVSFSGTMVLLAALIALVTYATKSASWQRSHLTHFVRDILTPKDS
jgi:hypothetical protein